MRDEWLSLFGSAGKSAADALRLVLKQLETECVEVFSDPWKAPMPLQDLSAALAGRQGGATMKPEDLCDLLVSLGVVDLTERVPRKA